MLKASLFRSVFLEIADSRLYFCTNTIIVLRRLLTFILILTLTSSLSLANAKKVQKLFREQDYSIHLDSLRAEYSANKVIPEEYELEILIALSYYPELKDVPIVFMPKKIKTTMATRPRMDGIYYSREKRTYRILINNFIESKDGINYNDVPFNARIGLIGHELGHVVDFMQKSMLRIISNGVAYVLNSPYRKNFEAKVDQITIEHGLGWQLYAFSYFVFHQTDITDDYLDFKEDNYPAPERYEEWLSDYPHLYKQEAVEERFDG